MNEHRDRKGLFKLLKSSNFGRDKPQASSNANTNVSKSTSRPVYSNKNHDQRNFERKEQRDKLINQNRVRTNSALTSSNSRPALAQQPLSTSSSHNNQILNIIKTRPVSKAVITRTHSVNVQSKAHSSNESLSTTYSIDQSAASNNLSRSSTISSASRKKLLEEWRKKKQDDEKSKPKKPAFKAGIATQPGSKSSMPTSSTFSFSLSLSGSSSKQASLQTKKAPPPVSSNRPPSSKPPIRSQSVRYTGSKETPKLSSINPRPKQTPISLSKPMGRKNTETNKVIAKPVDLTKELDIITSKINTSICLNTPKADSLNETHLNTQPNHTSSPIKTKLNQDHFDQVELEKRDVKYYRDLVLFSTEKLNCLGNQWSNMDQIPEEAQGDIRSACGLAKLLIDERFSQFNDLINQCQETKNEQVGLVVKCSDLQGFWDMVDVQIKDVCKKFDLLDKLKSNNYVRTADMVETQPESTAPKVFKPNKNYLRKKDQKEVQIEENKKDDAEKKPKARANNLAEFKARMKAMKSQSDQIEIQIAQKIDKDEEKKEIDKQILESGKKSRRSVRKSMLANDVPVEKKYNLRSRPSDLIRFDSPVAVKNNLEQFSEPNNLLKNAENFQSPVLTEKKSKKKSIYPMISEEDGDKENDDFFSLDDCPQITWKTRPSIYPTASITPARQTPKRVSNVRESFGIASSPLLKLSLITAQSKRLSVNSLNRIFDKLE